MYSRDIKGEGTGGRDNEAFGVVMVLGGEGSDRVKESVILIFAGGAVWSRSSVEVLEYWGSPTFSREEIELRSELIVLIWSRRIEISTLASKGRVSLNQEKLNE